MRQIPITLGLALLCAACGSEGPSSTDARLTASEDTTDTATAQNSKEWFGTADQLTDCSELALVAAEILNNSRQAEIAPGLDRAIEEQNILSARLRRLATKVATFGGATEQEYISHVLSRGPQFASYVANPQLFDRDPALQNKLNSCVQLINNNPKILEQKNIIFQIPIQNR